MTNLHAHGNSGLRMDASGGRGAVLTHDVGASDITVTRRAYLFISYRVIRGERELVGQTRLADILVNSGLSTSRSQDFENRFRRA